MLHILSTEMNTGNMLQFLVQRPLVAQASGELFSLAHAQLVNFYVQMRGCVMKPIVVNLPVQFY